MHAVVVTRVDASQPFGVRLKLTVDDRLYRVVVYRDRLHWYCDVCGRYGERDSDGLAVQPPEHDLPKTIRGEPDVAVAELVQRATAWSCNHTTSPWLAAQLAALPP